MQKIITFYVPKKSVTNIQTEPQQLPRQRYTRNHDCRSLKAKQDIKLDPRIKSSKTLNCTTGHRQQWSISGQLY